MRSAARTWRWAALVGGPVAMFIGCHALGGYDDVSFSSSATTSATGGATGSVSSTGGAASGGGGAGGTAAAGGAGGNACGSREAGGGAPPTGLCTLVATTLIATNTDAERWTQVRVEHRGGVSATNLHVFAKRGDMLDVHHFERGGMVWDEKGCHTTDTVPRLLDVKRAPGGANQLLLEHPPGAIGSQLCSAGEGPCGARQAITTPVADDADTAMRGRIAFDGNGGLAWGASYKDPNGAGALVFDHDADPSSPPLFLVSGGALSDVELHGLVVEAGPNSKAHMFSGSGEMQLRSFLVDATSAPVPRNVGEHLRYVGVGHDSVNMLVAMADVCDADDVRLRFTHTPVGSLETYPFDKLPDVGSLGGMTDGDYIAEPSAAYWPDQVYAIGRRGDGGLGVIVAAREAGMIVREPLDIAAAGMVGSLSADVAPAILSMFDDVGSPVMVVVVTDAQGGGDGAGPCPDGAGGAGGSGGGDGADHQRLYLAELVCAASD